jgi:DNA-binding NarL/FixJ family response regulator
MDVRMPGENGIAAALKMAELEERPVVVLCSSEDRPDLSADPRAHGADAFCCKARFSGRLLHELWASHGGSRGGSSNGRGSRTGDGADDARALARD